MQIIRWPRLLYRASLVSPAAMLSISTIKMARSDQSLQTRGGIIRDVPCCDKNPEVMADSCFISPPPCRFWRHITYADRQVNNMLRGYWAGGFCHGITVCVF